MRSVHWTAILLISLIGGCSNDDKYFVVSAKEEIRQESDHEYVSTVFVLKHKRTLITARCLHVSGMGCTELHVGEKYDFERHRQKDMDEIIFNDHGRIVAVLDVEAETVQPF
jgi:hypothetical protein